MAKFGGVALKSVAIFLRFIEWCCATIILAISIYYLVILHNHGLHIATYIRAATGISGAAFLYTTAAVVLVCCLGGITFFSLLGMLLDLAFAGAFIYIAYAYRGGKNSCKGTVSTPLGSGDSSNRVSDGNGGFTHLPSLKTACKLETAAFSVAIVGIAFFLLSMLVELALIKHHKKEKAFGPSPNNGYTAGSPKRKFWQRKPKHARDTEMGAAKVHPDALPSHTTPADVTRASYATDTTAVGELPVGQQKYGNTHLNANNAQYGHGHHADNNAAEFNTVGNQNYGTGPLAGTQGHATGHILPQNGRAANF